MNINDLYISIIQKINCEYIFIKQIPDKEKEHLNMSKKGYSRPGIFGGWNHFDE